MTTPFTVNLDLALVRQGRAPRQAYDAALARDAALGLAAQQHAAKSLELLGIPARTDDLKAATKQAAAIKGMPRRWRCWALAAPAWAARR